MLFVTHLAGGYLTGKLTGYPSVYVVLGAALPDVIDKPLGVAGIAPYYHTVGHSLLTLVPVLVLAILLGARALTAVAIGALSHVALDAAHVTVNRGGEQFLFVFYPVSVPPTQPRITDGSVSFLSAFWSNYVGTPAFYAGVCLCVAAALVYLRDSYRPDDA
jgi:Predicted membrane-bound metal-dependent hydrolase (DUF457).